MVTQTVPEVMSFKQTAQLLLGLRARVRVFPLLCVCVRQIAECNLCKQQESRSAFIIICVLYNRSFWI